MPGVITVSDSSADLSVKFGMLNACNCHEDKDAQWAADAIVARKGPGRPKEVRHPEAFHAFRSGKPNAKTSARSNP